jgi:hypothetical protein
VIADDRDVVAERARLVGRVALLVSVAPMLFFVWQAVGVPGMPDLGLGGNFAHADSGLVVRIADIPRDPVRVDHPVRINPRRARAAALLRASRTIKSAVAPATSPQDAPPPRAGYTSDATATSAPSASTGVGRDAPVAAPSLEVAQAQVPAVSTVQIPVVQIPPALAAAPDLPAPPPVLAPVLP